MKRGGIKMSVQNITPSRWYYGLAVLVAIIGTVFFAVFLFKSLSGLADGLIQVVVPGESDIVLTGPGNYTVFYEHQSVVGNKIYSTGEHLSGLQCFLIEKSTGSEIALPPASVGSSYSIGGRSGKSVLEFNIDKPGSYEFSAWYPEGQKGPEVVLAIGHNFTFKLMGTIFGGIAIFLSSVVIAVAITIITFLKRRKARRKLESSYT